MREEVTNLVGLECGNVDGCVAEAGGQQPPQDAQGRFSSLGRQAPHVVHVRIVAAELFVHGLRTHHYGSNGALSAQHSQEMPQRGAQRTTISLNRTRAVATRQMLINKLGDQRFVDALQP